MKQQRKEEEETERLKTTKKDKDCNNKKNEEAESQHRCESTDRAGEAVLPLPNVQLALAVEPWLAEAGEAHVLWSDRVEAAKVYGCEL